MLHEPTRRLWAEVNTDTKDERWNEGRSKLEAPRDASGVLDNNVSAEAQEDTGDDPKLPEHDERTTNASGGHLGGVDRDSGVLCSNADTHDETCREELLPRLCESGTNWSGSKAEGSHEDLAATTKVVVEGIDDEGATVWTC